MNYALKEILDIQKLRELLDSLDENYRMSSAIIDIDGTILIASAWQDICTKFHRIHPATKTLCIESDRRCEVDPCVATGHKVYRCPMGLTDSSTPIVIEGKHLGNVFIGQLFTEPPSEAFFIEQARTYGFVEGEYLAALHKVPISSEQKLHKSLSFIHALTQMLSEQGLLHKRQCEAEASLRDAAVEIQNAREYAENIVETVRESLLVLHSDLRVLTANHSFYTTFKVTPEETIGKFIYDLGNRQWDIPKLRVLIEEILPHDTVINGYEVEHDFPSIGRKTILLNARQIFREMIGSHIILLAMEDITERKQLEEVKRLLELQLQQSQKLESLGVLSGGIAHDFNNILAIIVGYCSLVKMDYETAEEHIPSIEKAAERAAELCRQMLAYAGKATISLSQITMGTLVAEVVTLLKSSINQNVAIHQESGPTLPAIKGDASQLKQVVMNLIINASEAIGEAQGEIVVSLGKVMIPKRSPDKNHLGITIAAGDYICLQVSDNGCGMDDETRQRIFEPFYTTKFTGRGLGMSAVLGIISTHKGALQLFSQAGQGTTFKVYLPMQESGSSGEKFDLQESSAPWQGSGTILLVEDDRQIQLIAKNMLKALGFTIVAASNGKEALEEYRKNVAGITLVMTDIGMPVMDGYALFHEIKKLNPDLPILISSGFGEAGITARIPRRDIAGLVDKPYNFVQLRKVLKSVVEGARQEEAEDS